MSHQSHDIGVRKRRARKIAASQTDPTSTATLARRLVDRGLADASILHDTPTRHPAGNR